jgi:hypothetical protein
MTRQVCRFYGLMNATMALSMIFSRAGCEQATNQVRLDGETVRIVLSRVLFRIL